MNKNSNFPPHSTLNLLFHIFSFFLSNIAEINNFFDKINGIEDNTLTENICDIVPLESDSETEDNVNNEQQLNENGAVETENGDDQRESEDGDGNEQFDTAFDEQMQQDIPIEDEEQGNDNDIVTEQDENNKENIQPEQAISPELMPPPAAVPIAVPSKETVTNQSIVKKSVVFRKAAPCENVGHQNDINVSGPSTSNEVARKQCFKCEESFIKESSLILHLKTEHAVKLSQTSYSVNEYTPGKFVRVQKRKQKRYADDDWFSKIPRKFIASNNKRRKNMH